MFWRNSFNFKRSLSTHIKLVHTLRKSLCRSKPWTLMFPLWGCLSDTWFEYSFREETVSVWISTQLQISKISIKISKAWTLMFPLWDTWFEYSFWEETVLCQICNSASNLKDFYQISKEWTLIFSLSGFWSDKFWILM